MFTRLSQFRRKTYPLNVRRELIKELDDKRKLNPNLSTIEFCRSKGIDAKQIRNFRSQLLNIEEVAKSDNYSVYRRRQLPRLRKPRYPLIDKFVLDFLIKTRANKLTVDGEDLKIQARIAYDKYYPSLEDKGNNPFKASNGWFRNFVARNRIVARSVTSIGQKIPKNANYLAYNFFDYIEEIRKNDKDFGTNLIVWNMDEVPAYFDSVKGQTFDLKGVKEVPVQTSGHEKTRFTVILCADNSGRKLKPGIIFRGLKYVPEVKNNTKFKLFAGIYFSLVNKDNFIFYSIS